MKKTILSVALLILFSWTFAQESGTITNIQASQRTGDEERVVDIAFTLSGTGEYYAISLGVKFTDEDAVVPIDSDEIIEGALIVEQGNVALTWDGSQRYSDRYAADAIIEITATRGMKDIDGNFYKSVLIGGQEWMAENLRTTSYKDGATIPSGHTNGEWSVLSTGAYAVYPHSEIDGLGNDAEVLEAYGALYNWYAVETVNLCPTGWHIPTDTEWTTLTNYVGSTVAGGKLKSTRTAPIAHPRWESPNTGATDEYGFSALPGGARYKKDYGFMELGSSGHWWTASAFDVANARGRLMASGDKTVISIYGPKVYGLSIRCLRD